MSATTGEDAVQLYAVHQAEVALILADVVMPRMGAFELVRTLRRQGRNPKFLLTSGYTQRAGDAAALEVPLLAKPWTPVVLARKVREVLDG